MSYANVGTNINPPLAVGKNAEEFRPLSKGQLKRIIPAEICLSRSHEVCALIGNLAQIFYDGKVAWNCILFLHLFSMLDLYFPPRLEKY